MASYDKATLVANLDKRIANEKAHDIERMAKYEFDLADWRKFSVSRLATAIQKFDESNESYGNYHSTDFTYYPPSKPSSGGSCSRAEEARARLLMMPESKRGTVSLSLKDAILALGVNCGHD